MNQSRLISISSQTAFRSLFSVGYRSKSDTKIAYGSNLQINPRDNEIVLPKPSFLQNLLYAMNQGASFPLGLLRSSTFRMRLKRILSPREIFLTEGKNRITYCKWAKGVFIILFNILLFIILGRIITNFLLSLTLKKYKNLLLNNNINEVIIITTNQECNLHLLGLSSELLGIKYSIVIDNWDNLSSKTFLNLNPNKLYVWSEQIIEHAQNIQKFKGFCKPVGSIRFIKLLELSKIYTKKNQAILFCGASVPSSEISFIKHFLKNTDCNLIYRPHPVGFYSQNKKAIDILHQILIDFPNRFEIVKSTYGSEPEEEIKILAKDLISSNVVICSPTSVFIECLSIGIPAYLLEWKEPDKIGDIMTKPSSWFCKGYLHISELAQNYPLIIRKDNFNKFNNSLNNNISNRNEIILNEWTLKEENKKFIIQSNILNELKL